MATSEIISEPEIPQTTESSPPNLPNPLPEKLGSRRWLSIPLIVGALAIGGTAFGLLAQLKEEPELREPVTKVYNVDVFPIQLADIPESFPAYGSANADRNVTITSKVSGDIVASKDAFKHLKVGQQVKPGKLLLFQIDRTVYQKNVTVAKKQVKRDEVALDVLDKEKISNQKLLAKAVRNVVEDRKQYQRTLALKNRNSASESELTEAKLKLQEYETAVTRIQNDLDLYPVKKEQLEALRDLHLEEQRLAEIDLKRTAIPVPFSGEVQKVHVEPGEYVRVGDPLVVLTNSDIVEIPMSLSLDDYGKIERMIRTAKNESESPLVSLAVNENSPFRWTGHVVRAAPNADEITRTVKVFVRVKNEGSSKDAGEGLSIVLPSMHYHGLIEGPKLKQVIVVPRDAITDSRVFVVTELKKTTGEKLSEKTAQFNGIAQERKVTVRRTLRDLAIIELGLKPGEFVILTNLDVIHNGALVRFRQTQIRNLEDEIQDTRLLQPSP